MLEFRAPLQRHCTRPQPKAEMDQNAKQKERRHIEQKPILAGRCPRGQLSCHDQGANGLLLTVGRHGEQGLQHGIGGGEKVVQHSAMRQQGSDRFGVAGWEPERRELVQPFLHGKCGCRRRVESEVQHGGGERAGGRDQGTTTVGCGEPGAEQPEIGERVLQQRVLALELLDQFFLPIHQRRETIDRRLLLGIRGRGFPQPVKCIVERAYLAHQRVVMTQQACACGQHVPMQRILDHGKIVKRPKLAIEQGRIQIQSAQQQPRQQKQQKRHGHRGW